MFATRQMMVLETAAYKRRSANVSYQLTRLPTSTQHGSQPQKGTIQEGTE